MGARLNLLNSAASVAAGGCQLAAAWSGRGTIYDGRWRAWVNAGPPTATTQEGFMHLDLLRNYLAQRDLADREEGGAGGRQPAHGADPRRHGRRRRRVAGRGSTPVPGRRIRPARRPRQGDFDDTYFDYSDPRTWPTGRRASTAPATSAVPLTR